jgi:hypothetical protein
MVPSVARDDAAKSWFRLNWLYRFSLFEGEAPVNSDWNGDVITSDQCKFNMGDHNHRTWLQHGGCTDDSFGNKAKFNKGLVVWEG